MKLLLFGATGPTGSQVAKQALERGHTVTAFVRDPAKLSIKHERLRVVTGDTTRNESAIAETVRGQDAVVSALGRRTTLNSDHLIERSLRAIVPAMERAGVRRLVLLSAFGVGDSHHEAPLLPRIMYRLLLRDIFADKKAGEDRVRQSSLDWTFVYPVLLTDGPLTGQYRAGERLELHGMPKISRADVAHFIVTELEQGAYVRKTAALSY
jgi:putative NADH-flavin reductase